MSLDNERMSLPYTERIRSPARVMDPPRRSRPLVAWPGWGHLRLFAALWAAVTAEFAVVFAGADFITAHRHTRLHAYWAGELAIPLVPPMVAVYMSIYLIFLPAPFILRSSRQIRALASALARVILIAGAGFLVFPAQLGFPSTPSEVARLDPAAAHRWGGWLLLADRLNLDYDLIPSLHVALFVACSGVYAVRAGTTVRSLLAAWALLVAASTVLTHQHQVIDALAGVALGAWGAVEAEKGRRGGAT
jgi:membrane-associated phospholipid phosphatase